MVCLTSWINQIVEILHDSHEDVQRITCHMAEREGLAMQMGQR
jgi:hypothetical protein